MSFKPSSILFPFMIAAAALGVNGPKKNVIRNLKNKAKSSSKKENEENPLEQAGMAAQAAAGSTAPPVPPTTCKNGDASQICLALKYVDYKNDSGTSVITRDAAEKTVAGINEIWKKCHIGFQIEAWQEVTPAEVKQVYHTANYAELDVIRRTFQDDKTLLIVNTGSWDRNGSLGSTGANAWTNLPGDGIYGAIFEAPVSTFDNIVAHELGHYLNLLHVQDESNLMNPILYDGSKNLTQDECSQARDASTKYWGKMAR